MQQISYKIGMNTHYKEAEFGYPEKFPWWTGIEIPSVSELNALAYEGVVMIEQEKWEAENAGYPDPEYD